MGTKCTEDMPSTHQCANDVTHSRKERPTWCTLHNFIIIYQDLKKLDASKQAFSIICLILRLEHPSSVLKLNNYKEKEITPCFRVLTYWSSCEWDLKIKKKDNHLSVRGSGGPQLLTVHMLQKHVRNVPNPTDFFFVTGNRGRKKASAIII